MTDLRKQWAIVQRRPKPDYREAKALALLHPGWSQVELAHLELIESLPRPIRVYRRSDGQWGALCRICGVVIEKHMPTHAKALESALWELHEGHGCPNRRTTGEPCDTACIHCHGWQWCIKPNERREL